MNFFTSQSDGLDKSFSLRVFLSKPELCFINLKSGLFQRRISIYLRSQKKEVE